MKNYTKGLLLIACLFTYHLLSAQAPNQDIIWQDNTFDAWDLQGGWDTTTTRVSAGPNWGERRAFQTPSGEQALLFDSDALGSGDPIEQQEPAISFPHEAGAISPPLELGNDSFLYLEFMQYYRSFQSSTSVDLLIPGRGDWISIPINQEYGMNHETPDSAYTVRLDLSAYAGELNGSRIRFKFRGTRYFWMIDDVKIIRNPDRAISEAIQPELTDKLDSAGQEYAIDYLGGVYHPRQLMVEWAKDTGDSTRQDWKRRNRVIDQKVCNCNPDVELLTFEAFVNLEEKKNLIKGFSKFDVPNGSPKSIWQQSNLPVEGGKNYYLSFRIKQETLGVPIRLKAFIGGVMVTSFTITPSTSFVQYHATYLANSTSTINLTLQQDSNTSTGYSIDYIYFGEGNTSSQNQTPASIQGVTEDCPPDGGEVQNWGRNYYDHVDTSKNTLKTPPDLPELTASSKADLVIAILDTGLDYESLDQFSADLNKFINPNHNECQQTKDLIGWNIINNNNLPYDDHSHGTHVTGILYKTLEEFANSNCGDIRLLTIKTHDYKGVGTEFDNVCGIYYAQQAGASLINASWGYYGSIRKEDGVMYNAIKKDPKLIFVTSSGNEKRNLDNSPNYPGSFDLDNIAVVGAVDETKNLWTVSRGGTNTSGSQVDFLADGVDIDSWIPSFINSPNYRDKKTGTSMAAPLVTANLAIIKLAENLTTAKENIDVLFTHATAINGLGTTSVRAPLHTYVDTNKNAAEFSCSTSICSCFTHWWQCVLAIVIASILFLCLVIKVVRN